MGIYVEMNWYIIYYFVNYKPTKLIKILLKYSTFLA